MLAIVKWSKSGPLCPGSLSLLSQDARKTFVSKTPPKFDFSTVSNSVMLTDNTQVDILGITGFRKIMSIPCLTSSIVVTYLSPLMK